MKFRVITNPWFMFWAKGMVFWPFVFVKYRSVNRSPQDAIQEAKAEQDEAWNRRLFRHELQHCYQVHRMGRVRFLLKYVWLYLRHGYKDHPMEIEARDYQDYALSHAEQRWYLLNEIKL